MKNEKKKIIFAFLLFGIILFSFLYVINFVSASQNLSAISDTYVNAGYPNANYGTLNDLIIDDGLTTGRKRIYIEFNLTNSSNIFSAKACFYLKVNGNLNNISIYNVYNSINETTITWNNQPCGTTFTNSTNCNLTSLDLQHTPINNMWYCWNITNTIKNAILNNKKNVTFVLKTPETIAISQDEFWSKDYSNATLRPYLEIISCIENWTQYNSTCGNYCGNWDKFQITYNDINNCGTNTTLPADNGTCNNCNYCSPTFVCSLFNATCSGNPPTNYNCIQANDTTNCCITTGLSSDCIYTGNLTDFDINYDINIFSNNSLIVPSYPYVVLNTSYTIKLLIPTNNASDIKLYILENGSWNVYNFSFIDNSYQITLIFIDEGDYPFLINGTNPCMSLTGDIKGVFLVRKSFNVTFCGFNQDNDYASYKNDYAYLIAEFTSSKKYYNDNLEQFITPLGFATIFKTPVFHTLYRNGCGTFKLYEANEEYVVRLFDGIATFQTTFSEPNISKTYGTNIYFGKYVFNGSDESFNVLLTNKDIKQYRWLFNWAYIILLGIALIGSIFMFFVIPEKPSLSLIFGLGFITMLTLVRVVLWIWQGW